MKTFTLAAGLAVGLACGPAQAVTTPWTDLVVFGDSLSDPGNIAPGLTFTDGQTYAGQLGALPFGAGGTNFAFGGARAVTNDDALPDFAAQRDLYRTADPALGDDPLTVIWLGGNDLLNATGIADVVLAVNAIATGLQDLAATTELDRFVLPGLPNLGALPGAATEQERIVAMETTLFFNGLLQQSIGALGSAGLDVTYFDTYSIFEAILDEPAEFGFTDTTGTCLAGRISCDGFVFWDDIHPTAAVHSILADRLVAASTPAPVPLPAAVWLLLGAVAALRIAPRRAA